MAMSAQPPHESPAGSHYQPSLGVVLVLLLIFVGGAYVMLRSPSSATTGTTTTTTTTVASGRHTTTTVVAKSRVRVQVANGTNITGLAGSTTQHLMTLGWDALPQLNAAKVTSTKVYYNPGYVWAARQIANEIKVPSSAVQPLNGLTPVPGASGDDVIVILGPDASPNG
jgi:LytR cell envelope-related transcriptional attenuator